MIREIMTTPLSLGDEKNAKECLNFSYTSRHNEKNESKIRFVNGIAFAIVYLVSKFQ